MQLYTVMPGRKDKGGQARLPAFGRVAESGEKGYRVILSSGKSVVIDKGSGDFKKGDRLKLKKGPEGSIEAVKIQVSHKRGAKGNSDPGIEVRILNEMSRIISSLRNSPGFQDLEERIKQELVNLMRLIEKGSVKEISQAAKFLTQTGQIHDPELAGLVKILKSLSQLFSGKVKSSAPVMVMNLSSNEIKDLPGMKPGIYYFRTVTELRDFITGLKGEVKGDEIKSLESLAEKGGLFMSADKTSSGASLVFGKRDFAISELSGFSTHESPLQKQDISNVLLSVLERSGVLHQEVIQSVFSESDNDLKNNFSAYPGIAKHSEGEFVQKASDLIMRGMNFSIDSSDFIRGVVQGTPGVISDTRALAKQTGDLVHALLDIGNESLPKELEGYIKGLSEAGSAVKQALERIELLQDPIKPQSIDKTSDSFREVQKEDTGSKASFKESSPMGKVTREDFVRMMFSALGLNHENKLAFSENPAGIKQGTLSLKFSLLRLSELLKKINTSFRSVNQGEVRGSAGRDQARIAEFVSRGGRSDMNSRINNILRGVERTLDRVETLQLMAERNAKPDSDLNQLVSIPVKIQNEYRDVKLLFKRRRRGRGSNKEKRGVEIGLSLSRLGDIGVEMETGPGERLSIKMKGLTSEGERWFLEHKREIIERMWSGIGFKGVKMSINTSDATENRQRGDDYLNTLIDMKG